MEMDVNKLYNLDCREGLKQLEDDSIDCCITSPPYWSLRDYGIEPSIWDDDPNCKHEWNGIEYEANKSMMGLGERLEKEKDNLNSKFVSMDFKKPGKIKTDFCSKCSAWKGCLGLEPNFKLFIKHLCDIYDLIKQKLKKTGTCWINLGDSYASNTMEGYDNRKGRWTHGKSRKDTPEAWQKNMVKRDKLKIQQKCLLMIPQRFAIEMINRGWILRNVIIWHKPNAMPSSTRDRFTVDFEYVYFFVKNRKYWFDQDAVREKSNTEYIYSRRSKKGGTQKKNNPRANWGVMKKELKERKSQYSIIEKEFRSPLIEFRELPEQEDVRKYLQEWRKKKGLTILQIEGHFGNQAGHHWFEMGGSYPSKEDWLKLKIMLGFDNIYDKAMTEVFTKSGMKQNNPMGRNKRCVWTINTIPNPEAHFATFPPTLVRPMIKAGCPKEICKKCSKARERIVENTYILPGDKSDNEKDLRLKLDGMNKKQNCSISKFKYGRANKVVNTKGWTDCRCNDDFKPGIVLDPFAGTGTTLLEAWKQGRNYIGFEISKEYCKIAEKSLSKTRYKRLTDF